jgi:hypothetical protein
MHKLHGEGIVNFDAEDDVEIYEGTVEKFMQIGTAILDKHTGASKVNQDSNTNGGTGNKSRFLKKDK